MVGQSLYYLQISAVLASQPPLPCTVWLVSRARPNTLRRRVWRKPTGFSWTCRCIQNLTRQSDCCLRMNFIIITWIFYSRIFLYSGLRRSCITEARAEVSGTWFGQQCACAIESHVPKSRASHIHIRSQITCPLTSAFASVMQDLRNPLYSARLSLLSSAPPPVASLLPDPSLNPRDFCDVLLGVNWIDSALLQRFCIVFLQHLRDARDSLLSIS